MYLVCTYYDEYLYPLFQWDVDVSERSMSFENGIRKIVDNMKQPTKDAPQPTIRLSIGFLE